MELKKLAPVRGPKTCVPPWGQEIFFAPPGGAKKILPPPGGAKKFFAPPVGGQNFFFAPPLRKNMRNSRSLPMR